MGGTPTTTIILCPRCKEEKSKTTHHVFPRRFFEDYDYWEEFWVHFKVYLCWNCHKMLEKFIPERERKPLWFYPAVVMWYLNLPWNDPLAFWIFVFSVNPRLKLRKVKRGKVNAHT